MCELSMELDVIERIFNNS
uniref:Uncharacterized protein n=1 Tax=Rhizophora mucronata TaxID=61149 RepID=A0A2P2PB78_RHIMU